MVNSLMYRIKLDKTAGLHLIVLRIREINVQKKIISPKSALQRPMLCTMPSGDRRLLENAASLSGKNLSGNPVSLFIRRPVALQADKGFTIGLKKKGVCTPFVPDSRFRRSAVIMTGKNTSHLWKGKKFLME